MATKIIVFFVGTLAFSIIFFPPLTFGQFLVNEDFEDGVADLFEAQDSFWRVENGEYICEAVGYEYYSKSIAGNTTWNDYLLECDIMVEGGYSHMVFVHLVDLGNFYEVSVRGAPWSDVNLLKWVDGNYNLLVQKHFSNTSGIWHKLQVGLVANEISVGFDDQLQFNYTDVSNPFLSGGIALVGYTGGVIQWQTAHFDNVIVTTEGIVSADSFSWDKVKALYR